MSFIVICTWRSSLIFVKSNFSKHGSGNCHLINSLTLHSLKTLPRDRPRLCSSCWRMLTNASPLLSMSFIVICTWRSPLIFVKSYFSRHGSCNYHLINSLTLRSLRPLPRDRPRLRSSCWSMLTNCKCNSCLILCKFSPFHVLNCALHLVGAIKPLCADAP